jgi:hypothetical protein
LPDLKARNHFGELISFRWLSHDYLTGCLMAAARTQRRTLLFFPVYRVWS